MVAVTMMSSLLVVVGTPVSAALATAVVAAWADSALPTARLAAPASSQRLEFVIFILPSCCLRRVATAKSLSQVDVTAARPFDDGPVSLLLQYGYVLLPRSHPEQFDRLFCPVGSALCLYLHRCGFTASATLSSHRMQTMQASTMITALAAGLIALAGAASAAASPAERAWVEMAPGGGGVVRVLTRANSCPVVTVDGRREAMKQRAAPAELAPRPNKAHVAAGASFPGLVCELPLPRNVRRAELGHAALPLPPARINRIALIGDTGCRLKDSDKAWQGCADPAQWPFAAIAAKAAALHPDLVLDVGDYLYRENPCPTGHGDCQGAAWGYG